MNTAVTSLPMTQTAAAGASTGAGLRHAFDHMGGAFRRALEAVGRARSHGALLDVADQCEARQPGLARQLRAATRQGPMA